MEKETLKKIFTFLEEEENKDKPFMWKLMNNEPLTDEELFVEGDLDLTETDIESLPDGLNVEDILSLYGCKNIQSLPEGLKVGEDLDLGHSNITSLPKGLKVWGRLFIKNTPLTKYSTEELRQMVNPGYINNIIR
jgi:hypothetical protein